MEFRGMPSKKKGMSVEEFKKVLGVLFALTRTTQGR